MWSGKLGILQFPQLTLNDCEWRVRPLAFLTARVSLKVKARVYDGALQSVVTLSPGGKVRLKDLAGVVPVAALAHIIPPNFVDGRIGLDLAKLTVAEQWVIDAHGTVDLVGLQLTSPIQEELGSYEIVFDGTRDNTLQGTISEVDGPLVASGVLSLNADRSWLLDGSVRPEPTASRQLVQALSMLGARSPDGSYPLSARGSN
ncbi:MAG: type II secretion system protein N [Gammaproteobacteria bacterium]|nr:type II secretion system protein N [Gammaproteobacteria bacterium]